MTDLQSSTAIATQALYNDGNGFFTGPTETANYRRLLDGGLINNSGGLGTIEDDLPFQLQYLEQVLGANPDLQIVWDYLKAVGAVDTSSPEASLLGILEHRARGRDT